MCSPLIEKLGASPANIQWTVVRGDTATLKVEFLEDDEVTKYDTGGWTFLATAYDPAGHVTTPEQALEVLPPEPYVPAGQITHPAPEPRE